MRAAFGSHPALKLRLGKEVVQAGNNAYRGPVLAVGICPAEGKSRRVERRGAVKRRLPCKGAELGPGPACSGGMQRAWLWTSASSWWPLTPALKGLMSVHRAPHSPVGTLVLRREDLARSTPVPLRTGTGGGRRGRAWALLASACTSTLPVLAE